MNIILHVINIFSEFVIIMALSLFNALTLGKLWLVNFFFSSAFICIYLLKFEALVQLRTNITMMNYLWPRCFLLAIIKPHCAWRQRRKYFFAIQNGTVSIRKWRNQLRRISWIKFLISVTLTRVVVQKQPVCSGFGLRISNRLTVSEIRGYCEKPSDTSAVAL